MRDKFQVNLSGVRLPEVHRKDIIERRFGALYHCMLWRFATLETLLATSGFFARESGGKI